MTELEHARHMMNLYYAVSLRARRRAAVWREEYKRLQYEKFEKEARQSVRDNRSPETE